ncbi:hypothetical protein CYMTET_31158, partial [Cymbomonas tetramitiformis]
MTNSGEHGGDIQFVGMLYHQGSPASNCILVSGSAAQFEEVLGGPSTTECESVAPEDADLAWSFATLEELSQATLCGFAFGLTTLHCSAETATGQ